MNTLIRMTSPEKTALITDTQTWTFDQLRQEVDRRAAEITRLPEEILVLRGRATTAFVALLLGAFQARKKVAVFADDWTESEAATRRALLGSYVECDDDMTIGRRAHDPSRPSHPDTALILFTSGSTGTPKGVQLSMTNIRANSAAVIRALDFAAVESQVLFLPLSYSYGLLGQLLPALEMGFTTRLVTRLTDLKEYFDNGQFVGMLSGVPSHWEVVLRLTDRVNPERLRTTHLVSAGAPLNVTLRKRLLERFPGATIYNNYGLTEASPRVLCSSSRHPDFLKEFAVGFPVGDFELRLSPEGELWCRGSQVMLGYLGDPVETAARVENGWLRTGDGAVIDESGLVSILGRKDDLFNIGGERTSPQEIESSLRKIQGVSEAAVAVFDDALYGKKIVGYLVCDDALYGAGLGALLRVMGEHMSAHKVPREVYRVESLPKNSNGKLVRARLPELASSARRFA